MSDKATEEAIEAIVQAEADRAVARYEGLCPPEMLDEMRRLLRLALSTHPTAVQLVRRRVPPPIPMESDKVETGALGGGGPGSSNGSEDAAWPGASSSRRGGGRG